MIFYWVCYSYIVNDCCNEDKLKELRAPKQQLRAPILTAKTTFQSTGV